MLRNCIVCGRLFKSTNQNICDKCTDDEESPYIKVREYLYQNRGASAVEVSEATGVSVSNILKLINDNRIALVGERTSQHRCPSCGEYISHSGFCSGCKDRENGRAPNNTIKSAEKTNKSFGNRSRRR